MEIKKDRHLKNYKMVLQYDGSGYDGWQRQGNTSGSIQGILEERLSEALSQQVRIHGSGRTDKGVHALGQTAHMKLADSRETGRIEADIRRALPHDIGLIAFTAAAPDFHSRFDARGKVYEYRIRTGAAKRVFTRRYEHFLGRQLHLKNMEEAAACLTGCHDFSSFTSDKRAGMNFCRQLQSITITERDGLCTLTFTGDGFLYHMVRILTGTLIEVGLGQRRPEDMAAILKARRRQEAGFTAPAPGLFLVQVIYG